MKRSDGPPKYIQPLEAALIKAEIEAGSNDRVKRALQTLCKLYWGGKQLLPKDVVGLETTILGALHRGNADEKVRRWGLSALAQLGRKPYCWAPTLETLKRFEHEPQVVAAGIAAAFKLDSKRALRELTALDIVTPEIIMISALQTASLDSLEGRRPSLDIENSSSTTLKLGLILVGLDRAPSGLFHPEYPNATLVRELSTHHEPLVSQYAVWAAAENNSLSSKDVALDPRDVESQPTNVRAYTYRLYGADKEYSDLQHEVIEAGSSDTEFEARLGCAMGIRDTWYDGIETIVDDWLQEEPEREISKYLHDHVVRQAVKSDPYAHQARELFRSYEGDAELRGVMLAAAQGTQLYSEFRRIEFDDTDMFRQLGSTTVVNNTINNNGSMQGVSVSGTGDISDSSNIGTLSMGDAKVVQALAAVREAQAELDALGLDEGLKGEVRDALEKAEEQPTQGTFDRALGLLTRTKTALEEAEGAGESIGKIAGWIGPIAQALGASGIGG